ncbi:MAG TPA: C40 family peptidase [Acidimicrobiales bacterium]|nr:C40 family peptidase [Acidimicrobiales bacterium]
MAFDREQLANAQTIISVGHSLGASNRDIQIALMTALVESGLHNVDYGDRDSLGLFQQRAAWGSVQQRMNPAQAATMFFEGGHGGQRGLFDFKNRDNMSMGAAAQAVQVSAYPDRYAQQTGNAAAIMEKVGASPASYSTTTTKTLAEIPGIDTLVKSMKPTSPTSPTIPQVDAVGNLTADDVGLGEMTFGAPKGTNGSSALDPLTFDSATQPQAIQPQQDPLAGLKLGQHVTTTDTLTAPGGDLNIPGQGWRRQAVKAAQQFLGTKYVWGGAQPGGFDCSGLIYYIYNHMLGFNLPRVSYDQAVAGKRVKFKDLRPGDLVAVDNNPNEPGADHVGIFVGNGMVIQAPHPGGVVELTPLSDGFSGGWGVSLSH